MVSERSVDVGTCLYCGEAIESQQGEQWKCVHRSSYFCDNNDDAYRHEPRIVHTTPSERLI